MNVSIIIIIDKVRQAKLVRLLDSIKPQLAGLKNHETGLKDHDIEIILMHESNIPLTAPELPLPVRYCNIPEKRGFAFNRNQGVKKANGDLIIFIDDDCWTNENWLKSLLDPFEKDNTLLAVTSCTRIPRSNLIGDCISALGFPGGGSLGFEKVWLVSKEGLTSHLTVGNCALKPSIFERVGYFDESMKLGAEDAEFSFRLEKNGIPIKYIPEAHAYHEARTTLSSFIGWQLRRGKANYQFKKRIGNVGGFVKLRFWSAKNILRKNYLNPRLPLIISLLSLSFVLQQAGYFMEKMKNE